MASFLMAGFKTAGCILTGAAMAGIVVCLAWSQSCAGSLLVDAPCFHCLFLEFYLNAFAEGEVMMDAVLICRAH